jgi:hypothetical protein
VRAFGCRCLRNRKLAIPAAGHCGLVSSLTRFPPTTRRPAFSPATIHVNMTGADWPSLLCLDARPVQSLAGQDAGQPILRPDQTLGCLDSGQTERRPAFFSASLHAKPTYDMPSPDAKPPTLLPRGSLSFLYHSGCGDKPSGNTKHATVNLVHFCKNQHNWFRV